MIIYSSETREKKRRCCEWKSKSNRKWFFSPERYIVSRSNRICVEAFFNSVGRQTTKNTGISIKEAESEGLIVSISPMAQKSYNPSSCNNFLQSVSVYTHVHASQKVWPLHTRGEENFHSSLWYFYYIVPFCLHISTDRFFLQDHPHTRKYNMNTQNMKNISKLLSASLYFLVAYNNTFCDTFNLGFLGHVYSQVIIISITLNVTCSCVLLLYYYLILFYLVFPFFVSACRIVHVKKREREKVSSIINRCDHSSSKASNLAIHRTLSILHHRLYRRNVSSLEYI